MEYVQDKILYHINSKGSINIYDFLKVGDVIKTTNYNPFRNSYEIGECDLKAYWRFAKELAIEQTRMQINKDLPSRWHCLWLSDEEHLTYWEEQVHNQNYQVLKMKLCGRLFHGDAHWVESGISPLVKIREKADYYWDGVVFRPSKMEYLFEGTAEVISVEKQLV